MIYARVKDVIKEYVAGGFSALYKYLNQNDICIDDPSWINDIKNHINNKEFIVLQAKLDEIIFNLKLHKNIYNDEKKNNTRNSSTN